MSSLLARFIAGLPLLLALAACDSGGDPLLLTDPLIDEGNTDEPGGGSGGGIGGSGLVGGSEITLDVSGSIPEPVNATGLAVGPISSFGSVILNGQRFETDSTTITVNGEPALQDDLRVGMVIWADVDFTASRAIAIEYRSSLIGYVDSVDLTAGQLTIMDQIVDFGRGGALHDLDPVDLVEGLLLEISGQRDSNGKLIATMIRQVADSTSLLLVGNVSEIASNNKLITVNTIDVSLGSADLSSFVDGIPVVGQQVIVRADGYTANGKALDAHTVTPVYNRYAEEPVDVQINGYIEDLTNSLTFTIQNQAYRVSYQTAIEFPDNTSLDNIQLSRDLRVEIEGTQLSDGTIDVERVIILPRSDGEIKGRIASLDADRQTASINGVDVKITSDTHFKSRSSRKIRAFGDILVGDVLEVEGFWQDQNDSQYLVAQYIELEKTESEAEVELTGPVTHVDIESGVLEVMGIQIHVDEDTEFEIGNQEFDSFTTLLQRLSVGDIVSVEWEGDSTLDSPADEIELEQ